MRDLAMANIIQEMTSQCSIFTFTITKLYDLSVTDMSTLWCYLQKLGPFSLPLTSTNVIKNQ